MIAKVFSKPQTQQVIKDLRKAGYTVAKTPSGIYELRFDDGQLLFAAMPGNRGYLVRYAEQLLTAV